MEDKTQIITVVSETTEAMGPLWPDPFSVVDTGFQLWDKYIFVLEWFFPLIMGIAAYIVLRHLIWNSLRFNYYNYLECGEFMLCWGDNGGDVNTKRRRIEIAKKIKCEKDLVSWFAALLMSVVVFAAFALIALLWPATVILVIPLMVVRAIGYRKRKKIVFVQKISGDHLNESV